MLKIQTYFHSLQGPTLSHSLLIHLHLETFFYFHSSYTGLTIWSHMDLNVINSTSSQALSIYLLHVGLRTLISNYPNGWFLFSLIRPPLLQKHHPDHPINLKNTITWLHSLSTTILHFTFFLITHPWSYIVYILV